MSLSAEVTCLLSLLLILGQQVSSVEVDTEDLFVGPWCNTKQNDFNREKKTVTLVCYLSVRDAGETTIDNSTAERWLAWSDDTTRETLNGSSSMDWNNGWLEVKLEYTSTFHVYEDGRQFVCVNQLLNQSCTAELDFGYGPWCNLGHDEWNGGWRTIYLDCGVTSLGTNSSAIGWSPNEWLAWYDNDTNEVSSSYPSLDDQTNWNGFPRFNLKLDVSLNTSAHSREFVCVSQLLNRSCSLTVEPIIPYELSCWTTPNWFYPESTSVTLTCHLLVEKANSSAVRRLSWYDAETNKVSNDSEWTVEDHGDKWGLSLHLTNTFNVSEHGRVFVCVDHLLNQECSVNLELRPQFDTTPQCSERNTVREDLRDNNLWCHIREHNVTTRNARLSPETWLIWYDGNTGEVANYSASLSVEDQLDGFIDVKLRLTGLFDRSDHGRRFVCVNQITNATCTSELEVIYDVAPFKSITMLRYEHLFNQTIDSNLSTCMTLGEWTWWMIDLEEEFTIHFIQLHVDSRYCEDWDWYWWHTDDNRDLSIGIYKQRPSNGGSPGETLAFHLRVSEWNRCTLDIELYPTKSGRFVAIYMNQNFFWNVPVLELCGMSVFGNVPVNKEYTTLYSTTIPAITTSVKSELGCSHKPCFNGGTCIDTFDGMHQCTCRTEVTRYYTGKNCETAVDTTPLIREVSPQYGPEAGGTLVTLEGNHLKKDNGTINVQLSGVLFKTTSQNDIEVVAETPQLPNGTAKNEKMPLRVVFSSGLEASLSRPFTFEYHGNPVVESIHPLEAWRLLLSGIQLTVSGNSFDSVAEPIMVITAIYNNTKKRYNSSCSVESSKKLICPSPAIDEYLLKLHRSRRDVDERNQKVEYHISFLLDGVQDYNEENFAANVPQYSQLHIIADPPKLKQWDEILESKPGEVITIFAHEGEDLQKGCTIHDYAVDIDLGQCLVQELHANNLLCKTPTNRTGLGPNRDGLGDFAVTLKIGNYSSFIGHLRYKLEESSFIKWLLIGSGLVLFILILSGIVTSVVLSRRSQLKRKNDRARNQRNVRTRRQRVTLDVPPSVDINAFRDRRAGERPERLMAGRLEHIYLNPGEAPSPDYLQPLPQGRYHAHYYNHAVAGSQSRFAVPEPHDDYLIPVYGISRSGTDRPNGYENANTGWRR